MLKEDERWFQVSLRFMGDALPVDEISLILAIKPSHIGRKGENINNNPRYARYETNIWSWTFTKNSSVNFEEQISELLDVLETKAQALLQILALPNVEGELFLGFGSSNGQGGAHFPASFLQRIAVLDLNINLDLYPKNDFGEDEWRTDSSITS